MEFYLTYPDYNTKAFTVSYDDGTIQDKKVMSLAKKYGRIIVMEDGFRVGDGTHSELLANCETYQKMNKDAGESGV